MRRAIPLTYAALEERSDGILLWTYDDNLDRLARFLIPLCCPFMVIQPPELLETLEQLAESIADMIAQTRGEQASHLFS